MLNDIPAHQAYSIFGFPFDDEGKPVATLIDFAATYKEAEVKAKWARANHIHGAAFRNHSGRRIATGKIEIRKTRNA